MKIEDMTIDQLKLHISDLEALMKYSRSESQKGELSDSIKLAKNRINELTKSVEEKKASFNKEAPARADHVDSNSPSIEVFDNYTTSTVLL